MSQPDGAPETARRASTRNPRRRPRHDSDSLPHQPRRKRSKIAKDTFEPETAIDRPRNGTAAPNGHAEQHAGKSATPFDALEVPVRAKKSAAKRANKGDGSVLMTQNDHYSIRQLPSMPDILRNSASDFRGSILSSPSYALALTREHAYVWDYTAPAPVTHPRSFDVPHPPKPGDPLPLGALVTNGASTSVGLVVISSITGKMTFWENIDTAESLSLFQHNNAGVEGSLGTLFSGELAVEITSADHAGFIVTLSSGRMARIGLRDPQGKPKVTAQFLKSNESVGGGGLFGSLKGVLGVGWKRDVVGVRTRSHGLRGQIQVYSATANAQIQSWDLTWSGHSSYTGAIDFRELLLSANGGVKANPRLVDFAIPPSRAKGNEVSTLKDDGPVELLLLVENGDEYTLVDVTLVGSKAYIERVIPLQVDPQPAGARKPSLSVPKPGHMAYVIFQHQTVLASLVAADAGPEAQLLGGSPSSRAPFQDTVTLRADKHVRIQGSGEEDIADRGTQSACVVFIKNFGLARLTASEPDTDCKSRMSIKSRIEQAIFYGTLPDNIIDFSDHSVRDYSQEDVEEAALAISAEILRSESPYLSAAGPSTESQLNVRVKAVRALIVYVKKTYGSLSHLTAWKLMTDAEKLAVGHALWTNYEYAMQKSSPKPSVLLAVVKMVRKQTRGIKILKEGEGDEIRHWFTHDLGHLDKLCYQTLFLVNNGYENNSLQHLMKVLSECDDILFGIYETVFAFRFDNAEQYGLDPTMIPDGVLEQGWEDLPEPWTATHEVLNLLDHFIDIARKYAVDLYEKPESQRDIDDMFVGKVVHENVRLVQILCRCYRERYGWCAAHYAEKFRDYAPGLADKFKRSRAHHLRGLVEIGQAGAGIAIAERYRDMQSLVKLVISESAYLVESLAETGTTEIERNTIQTRMDGLQANVERYFRIFGDEWATAFFDSHLTSQRSYGLLKEADLYQGHLTRYLRAEKARGRLAWINDVLAEHDLGEAQKALTTLAREQETMLWNKKVELSLAKLASLGLQEEKQGKATAALKTQEAELAIVGIQEAVYAHLEPMLYAAVDHDAEVQLVADAYATNTRATLPALHQLLEIALDDLLSHIALPVEHLVDVLTLMDGVPSTSPDTDIAGRETVLALQLLVAAQSTMEPVRWSTALRLVCKRAYLADEWDVLNDTARKSDRFLARQVRGTALCATLVHALQLGLPFLDPNEVVGAGCEAADLVARFPEEDLREPIRRDNEVQDGVLRGFVRDARLEEWVRACREEAKKTLDERAEAEREAQRGGQCVMEGLGNAGPAAGIKVNGKGKHGEDVLGGREDMDGDGDMDTS